ncbi:hypothetical protein H9P43_006474 [Blastocladiella emersonii ATCC 22665]|nr:hypothetical protein H9P43_006474 [Blastocladiella emersonii ATCC 22665]
MTEAAKAGTKKVHNQVHDDAIWRQMIQNEYVCASNWDKNWAFMAQAKYPRSSFSKSKRTEAQGKSALPPITPPTSSSVNSVFPAREKPETSEAVLGDLATYNVKHMIRRAPPQDKYTFPATTAEAYGWQFAAHKGKVLDRFARVAPGRVDTLKWWGGARESLP